jgi:methionyl-tRNA formyltransferase
LNKLRAFSDVGLFTFLNGQRIKIFSAKYSNKKLAPAEILVEGKRVFVGVENGSLELLKLQFTGKKPINVSDAVNGGKFKDAKRFSDG